MTPDKTATEALATALHGCEIIPGSWNCSYREEGITYADCPNRLAHVAFAQRILAALPADAALFTESSLAAALLATYNERHGKALHPSPLTESRAIIQAAKEARSE